MNTKKLLLGIVSVGFVCQACFAFAANKGPESIILQGGSTGDITFPHGLHQKLAVDCQPCHTLFPKETDAISKMHAANKMNKKAVMAVCNNCHRELANLGKKAGPPTCKGCHNK